MTVTMTGSTGPRVVGTDDGVARPGRRKTFRSIDSDYPSRRCGPWVRPPGAHARWAHSPWEWDVLPAWVSRSTASNHVEASS